MHGEIQPLIDNERNRTMTWDGVKHAIETAFTAPAMMHSAPSNSHATPPKLQWDLVKQAGVIIKYSHVPVDMRDQFVDYLFEHNISVVMWNACKFTMSMRCGAHLRCPAWARSTWCV